MFNVQAIKVTTPVVVRNWAKTVTTNGGGFENNSLIIASHLIRVLQVKSYYPKIKYLLPMLGVGIGAARAPLIDVLGVGSSTSNNFIDGDFSQNTGLQGNGSNKWLDTTIKPAQLGSSNNGAYGWWENNINLSGNVEPVGCYSSGGAERYVLDLRSSFKVFSWGNFGNNGGQGTAATNGHYYGQRASATSRTLYFNGTSVGTNANNDTSSGANDTNIRFVGSNGGDPAWPGRCAVAYLTDGTLTSDEIVNLDEVLRSVLMIPSGKPTS